MTIFISQSSDALNPHQSVLNYHQLDPQISDKSDEPCLLVYLKWLRKVMLGGGPIIQHLLPSARTVRS
jgi:hypothetical protein